MTQRNFLLLNWFEANYVYKSTNSPFSQTNSSRSGNKVTDSSPAKVAELQNSGLWIQQQILGLDVPMADPK